MTYSGLRASAAALIARKGAVTTFTRPAGTAIDPVTQVGGGAPVTYTAKVVAAPLSAGRAAQLFGGAADPLKPRLSLTIAADGATTPAVGDRFVWSGRSYRLLSVDATDPDGSGAIVFTGLAEA